MPFNRASALAVSLSCFLTSGLLAQTSAPAAAKAYVAPRKAELTKQFEDFLSMPNVALDPVGLRKNAEFLKAQLEKRGFAAQLLTAPGLPAEVPPVVYGEMKTPGATRTIVLYAHYDGQPVTPSEWENGDPFKPVEKMVNGELRVYARSAGDDKDSIFAQLTALDALKAAKIPLRANVRFIWEGEEEHNSIHLEEILTAHRDLVHGDVLLVCDGPVDQTRQQEIVFGNRGDTHMQITVYGPNRTLHSGIYGNWAPNPAMMLVHLLGGMKDEDGKVLIPHFYDGIVPFGPKEKAALAAAPSNEELLRKELSLGHADGAGKRLLELYEVPTLNINGIAAGQTGDRSANAIMVSAMVNLDLRLVVGIDWKVQQQRVTDYIKSQGYWVIDREPTHEELYSHAKVAYVKSDAGENASRTSMDLPIAADVIAAVESARGKVILLPTVGGTVPIDQMVRATQTQAINVPMANHDDNQHAANENLRMQNMWDGIETMAALIDMK